MGKTKLNIPMCAAVVLLYLTLLSIHLTSGLFARYTTTVTASDSARVAKFDVDVTAGLLQSLALPVGMGIGTLVVPWLTDRFCPNNRLAAVVAAGLVGAVAVSVFFLLDPTNSVQLVLIELLLFVAGFCIYAINGTAWAYATDIGGRVFSGTSAGVLDFAAYMGAAAQSLFYGFLLDNGGWNIVFISIAAFCVLVAVLGAGNSVKRKK